MTEPATHDAVPRWHGTTGGYTNHKCRCDGCRAAWAEYTRGIKARRASTLKDANDPRHGKASFYGNHGCRCIDCTAAWTAAITKNTRNRRAKL